MRNKSDELRCFNCGTIQRILKTKVNAKFYKVMSLYGAESWTFRKSDVNKISAAKIPTKSGQLMLAIRYALQ